MSLLWPPPAGDRKGDLAQLEAHRGVGHRWAPSGLEYRRTQLARSEANFALTALYAAGSPYQDGLMALAAGSRWSHTT